MIRQFIYEYMVQVYENELEKVTDFKGCEEWVQTFDLYRGKKVDDEEDDSLRVSAKFKVC